MTYKINGVTLTDPARGWKLLRGSTPASALEYATNSMDISGWDGTFTFPTTRKSVSFTFTIKSSLSTRTALLTLMGSPTLEVTQDDPLRDNQVAEGRLISSSVDQYHEALGYAVDSFVIEIPSGAWRSKTVSTTTKLVAASPLATVNLLSGISAPVQDAIVRIQGPITNPQVQDSGGSFFVITGTIPDGSYIRFESVSGRAWINTTDTWVGGTELTGEVDFGGPRGTFEITPNYTDPNTRVGKLTLTQTARGANSGMVVKARNSYLF